METISKTHFMDKAINGLRKAAVELEDFQAQLTINSSEIFEKYQEIKNNFHGFMHESLDKLREEKVSAKELTLKFHEIEKFLISEKVDTRENFIAQTKKIIMHVEEMEEALKNTAVDGVFYVKVNTEIEKFKIKMEILGLRFEMGKLEARKEFESLKSDFTERVDKIKIKFTSGEPTITKSWDHFSNECSEAYKHLKRAFVLS